MLEGMNLESGMPIKSPLPHAPWLKNEVDEFEDLTEADIPKKRTELADKALISAVKTIAEIERDKGILAYKRHPRIQTRFDKDYQTQVSFGLHIGITIEGSIGSEFKIDYLNVSPDSAIAVRINELCEHYDTQILLTGDMYDTLSERAKNTCRLIDRIQIKESEQNVLQLYSLEMRRIDDLMDQDEEYQNDDVPLNQQ